MNDPLHEIANLVLSLPEPWRGYLIAAITLSTSVSTLLLIVKRWWTPDPNPAPWKRALYRMIDYVAQNSQPLMKQVESQQKERLIAAQQFAIAQKDEAIERKTGQLHKALGLPKELRSMRGTSDEEDL